MLTGCSTLGFGGSSDKQPATDITVAPQADASGTSAGGAAPQASGGYVAGKCPQVAIRDEDSVYRVYAKGAKDDPSQLVYQASLAQATRQCTTDGTTLGINVVAQGRLVGGPQGGTTGKVTLPIHVAVMDDSNALYSQTIMYPVDMPPGMTTTQFLFTQDNIRVPAGSGGFTNVVISFDQGPQKTEKAPRAARRKH
jgi:hypothetical protein